MITTIIVKYIFNFIQLCTLTYPSYQLIDLGLIFFEAVFFIDVAIHLLHNFWPIVRLYIRVYRRNMYSLAYDILSLLPITLICNVVSKYEHFNFMIFVFFSASYLNQNWIFRQILLYWINVCIPNLGWKMAGNRSYLQNCYVLHRY